MTKLIAAAVLLAAVVLQVSGQRYIEDIIVICSSHSNPSVPHGYFMNNVDLNKGAGGDYIYFAYKRTWDKRRALKGLHILRGNEHRNGYIKINVDLNRRAGGKYIYLAVRRDYRTNIPAVTNINVAYGNSRHVYSPYDYHRIPVDLNEGAGGAYIYLSYQLGW